MSALLSPICRRVFPTERLVSEFPPRFFDRNKQIVHRIACPPGSTHSGELIFSRWARQQLPDQLEPGTHRTEHESREDYFGYEPTPKESGCTEWYLNFSHYDLFCAYGSPLFAQDEMQVAEHPALGSLREALLRSDLKPLTVEDGEPTPVLILGVERRCRVATNPDAKLGRPSGLYGNHFARASAAAIEKATQRLDPPTVTNIIAMEAPAGGRGAYTRREIDFILSTAYTGFAAARQESQGSATVIHTGFWGCGAYGGNRVLMALLQGLAAELARVDRLVFHTGDSAGSASYLQAMELLAAQAGNESEPRRLAQVLVAIEQMEFQWGVGDGN